MHVERISVGTAATHLQRSEHVSRAAGEPAATATFRCSPARRWRTAPAISAAASTSAHHHKEALEDSRRQECGEAVVLLIQPKAVQIARRRLKVITFVQRHGFAVCPSERFTIQREEVLEVSGVKVGADSATRPTFRDDEEKLSSRVRVAREERVTAEALAAAVSEHIRTKCGR